MITRTSRTTTDSHNVVINSNVYVNGPTHGRRFPTPYRVKHGYTKIVSPRHNNNWWSWDNGVYVLRSNRNSCGLVVSVPWHGVHGVTYYYPSYHRSFVFFSIGGYWPSWYRYRRYYWYGCHPYRWYSTNIFDIPVTQDINVYHHYPEQPAVVADTDYDDFSDVRLRLRMEKLEQEFEDIKDAEDLPAEETAADRNFDDAVNSFAAHDYTEAILKFRVAMILDPEDIILPFAYSQALFANGEYAAAASVLRTTLNQMPRDKDKETVFYPRGLYKDEKVLNKQLAGLALALSADPANTDLNLLYGYHLLGVGQIDDADKPLALAAHDPANKVSVTILLDLLEKVKQDRKQDAEKIAEPID